MIAKEIKRPGPCRLMVSGAYGSPEDFEYDRRSRNTSLSLYISLSRRLSEGSAPF